VIILLAASLLLNGCATTVDTRSEARFEPATVDPAPELSGHAWWQLRFKLAWPEGRAPDFSGHPLLAEQILLPLIVEHRESMPLWRFHRRAGRDDAGHQFSLIFTADEATARQIGSSVEQDPLVAWLQQQGMLEKTSLEQRGSDELARLEQTSDPEWPLEIQQSWPWFIMGTSTAWLMQVQAISLETGLPESATYPQLRDHYRRVSATINAQWRDFGQHAYFHHINAIYGYQPVRIRSNDLRRF
jgi:hypothetical protein